MIVDGGSVCRNSAIALGYEPVLLETFVERGRFTGACYRAANWRYLQNS